jgi:hypothetical protein
MKRIVIFILLASAAAFAACSNSGQEGTLKPNQPPTVWLSAGPPEGSTSKYRIQMFWGGWDPDGEIAGYEYLISDNQSDTFQPSDTAGVPWLPVAGNDSTFTFSADQQVDTLATTLVTTFTRSHTFFIRAVDKEGLRSKHPAYRSFTARNLSPDIFVQVPKKNQLNPAEVPPITTFRWVAKDYIDDFFTFQEPDSVQWALVPVPNGKTFEQTIDYVRTPAADKEWQPWVWYKAPQDSGKFWTTPVTERGNYVFAIRAKDQAGAITPVLDEERNVRRVRVGPLSSGPLMSVTNDYIGVIRTTSCTTPTTILDSPAGVPLDFKIRATADSYGGTISGYRYGWDIPDLNDPEQWEIDVTPFLTEAKVPPRAFFFGTHTLTMEVVDNSGYCSRVEVKVNIVQFTLERNMLVVDDDVADEQATSGWNNGGSWPNDAEQDAFWQDMVSEVAGFDPEIDMVNTKAGFIPLATLAQYKSIIWDVYSDPGLQRGLPLLYSYISHRPKNPDNAQGAVTGKVLPNVLALTMAAGGHIMICGNFPIQDVCSRIYTAGVRFPIIWKYELEGKQTGQGPDLENPVGDKSFAYRELCLETMDFSIQNSQRARAKNQYCRIDRVRPHGAGATSYREDSMREALSADPNFPTLSIRPEAAAPGKWYDPASRGLDVEVYNPLYFRSNSGLPGSCQFVPPAPRSCFQPIYNLGCIDTQELTYNQPIAFWTSAFADRVAEVPGAVGARSVVFGFPPVFTPPDEFRPSMDYILFNEWKLPRRSNLRAAGSP